MYDSREIKDKFTDLIDQVLRALFQLRPHLNDIESSIAYLSAVASGFIRLNKYACVCVCVCMYICMYMYVYAYINVCIM